MPKLSTHTKYVALMVLQSIFCILLLYYRSILAGDRNYYFLLLNLSLAWIPLIISLFIKPKLHLLINLALLSVWLLFLPNAGYIITDLLHLSDIESPVLWLDTLVLFSFSLNSLSISGISIEHVYQYLIRKTSLPISWALITGFLFLASIGVYMGRFLRFNSWDILSHPQTLVLSTLDRYINPTEHPVAIPFTLIIFTILVIDFMITKVILESNNSSPKKKTSK